MAIDLPMVLASGVVGVLVGLSGAGGGALMTPMLVLVFSLKASSAIPSDLVAAVVMRPVGAAVHFGKKTINPKLVAWLALGSVPAALFGSYLLHLLGSSTRAESDIERLLGGALLLGAAAMVLRRLLDKKKGEERNQSASEVTLRPVLTVAIGALGGLLVGLTSVGAGSLMMVLLLFCYPRLGARELVGTDLAQAVPLTLAAAAGALAFNSVAFSVTASLIAGSVPGVLAGSLLSSRAPDGLLRPLITLVIGASGLKYLGAPDSLLGLFGGAALLGWLGFGLAGRRRARIRPGRPAMMGGLAEGGG